MKGDYYSTLLSDTVKKVILDWKTEGMSDEAIIKKLNDVDMNEAFLHLLEKAADDTVDFFKSTMHEKVMEYRADTAEFLARQEQKWGKCFVASEAMYIMVIEAADQYSEYVSKHIKKKKKENLQYTYFSLLHIHGRACQQYLEILFLMRHGFADGAYARWRSMYELCCIAEFIIENGEVVAEEYLKYSEIEDNWQNWAKVAPCFLDVKKKNISFSDIQDKCSFASVEWRKQYQLANKAVHASPQGTFGRLSNTGKVSVIPVGHSDYGITTPAEHSAISLALISNLFFGIFPRGDGVVTMNCINQWIDVIRDFYFKTADEVFGDEKFKPIIKKV